MFERRTLKVVIGALLAAACCTLAAEAPPRELLEYIQEAQKLGVAEQTIREKALAAGWSTKLIAEALEYLSQPGAAATGKGSSELPEGYRIGAGDVLQISVWKDPDASVGGVMVRADGKVSLPLVKEIELAGLTPHEAEALLADKLKRFIQSPNVTVIVREIHSRKVYMVGAVKSVGALNLTSRLTVLQAITQAGGVTDYAKKKKIYILRNQGGKQVRLPFNYEAVIRGEEMEQNIFLEPDDTVVVPQ